jgi:hypothetical protein
VPTCLPTHSLHHQLARSLTGLLSRTTLIHSFTNCLPYRTSTGAASAIGEDDSSKLSTAVQPDQDTLASPAEMLAVAERVTTATAASTPNKDTSATTAPEPTATAASTPNKATAAASKDKVDANGAAVSDDDEWCDLAGETGDGANATTKLSGEADSAGPAGAIAPPSSLMHRRNAMCWELIGCVLITSLSCFTCKA